MRRFSIALSVLALCACTTGTLPGQSDASLFSRLSLAETATSLDAPDMRPWHLRMTVQLFDRKGQVSDEGTLEEWWNSPELDRREYKTKAYTATEIRSGGKVYRSKGIDVPPHLLELLRQQVVAPVALPEKPEPDLHKLNVGKIALDCIQLRTPQEKGPGTLGSSRAYCMDAGSNSLRMTLDHSIMQMVRERVGQFQGKQVAVGAVVSGNGFKLATEHIDSLAGGAAPESLFAVSAEALEPVAGLLSNDHPTKTMGAPIFRADPLFPVLAKAQNASSGVVVVRAIVGIDGKVRSIGVVATANPVFDEAAMDAVRKWRYQPSTENGQPVELEAVIVVRFATAQSLQ